MGLESRATPALPKSAICGAGIINNVVIYTIQAFLGDAMELKWDDYRTRKFVTNVGLITSDGPNGPNMMAAEWVHHVSYSPSLIAVCLGPGRATVENIRKSRQFGISIASSSQSAICSIAGGSTGLEVDKVAQLGEFGLTFYPAKKINAPMPSGAAMNAECTLLQEIPLGDHVMFVGEVVEISADEAAVPLIYHAGRYWEFGAQMQKPPEDVLAKINALKEKYKKK
jgi:flavin reductase (DIM6/NTAB) family NADH-FMN oxidoreductase RutF